MDEFTSVQIDWNQWGPLIGQIDNLNTYVSDTANYTVYSYEMLQKIYVAHLFVIGVVGAIIVCFILYKFLKAFY